MLLYLIADGGRRGYRNLLDAFWDEAKDFGLSLPTDKPVSAAAFCKARQRLKPEAIRYLLRQVAHTYAESHGSKLRFRGRRVFAIDGCKTPVQRSSELWQEFGGPTCGYCPQIMISALFDVVGKVPIDATICPYGTSEREQAEALVESLEPGAILVLDRGYPSHDMIDLLLRHGIDFVMRVPTRSSFHVIDSFVEADGLDRTVKLLPPKDRKNDRPTPIRIVRGKIPGAEDHVYFTSLTRSEFPREDIQEIYRMRWEVELFYRLEQGDYIGHHQFHAKKPDGVKQEVYALLLFVAMSRLFMATASGASDIPYDDLSQKGALLATAGYLTRLLLHSKQDLVPELMQRLIDRISRLKEPKRPGRSFQRRSFKPRPRWGPNGKMTRDGEG